MKDRTTITIDKKIYYKLKEKGNFGETYSQLISRLIDTADAKIFDGDKLKVD